MQNRDFSPTPESTPELRHEAPLLEDGIEFDLHKSNLPSLEQRQAMAAAAAAYDQMTSETQPIYEGFVAPKTVELPTALSMESLTPEITSIALARFRRTETSDKPKNDVDFTDLYEKVKPRTEIRSDFDLAA
jgi:hypothetical protein